jgi:hypothetical protein
VLKVNWRWVSGVMAIARPTSQPRPRSGGIGEGPEPALSLSKGWKSLGSEETRLTPRMGTTGDNAGDGTPHTVVLGSKVVWQTRSVNGRIPVYPLPKPGKGWGTHDEGEPQGIYGALNARRVEHPTAVRKVHPTKTFGRSLSKHE